MKIKTPGILIPATLIIVALVLMANLSGNRFRQGAEIYASPALHSENQLWPDDIRSLEKGTLLLIDEAVIPTNNNLSIVSISLNEIGSRDYYKSISKSTAPLVIIADNPLIESRAWMLIAQKGIKELFVYTEAGDVDVLKYEFRPDTLVSN